MNRGLLLVLLVAGGVTGCSPGLREPVSLDFTQGNLDLKDWNFGARGPVNPQGWVWDADVLWSPVSGRPALPPPLAMGPPDKGGSFASSLEAHPGVPASATARITLQVDPFHDLGLQIGAFPGAYRIWVNGVMVHESGVLSVDPSRFHADGIGAMVTVQPRDGTIDVVAEMVTSDPLVRHSEMNRLWVVGPADAMMVADRSERNWRTVQATILLLGFLVFFWLGRVSPARAAPDVFVAFLSVCLLKLLANVEQAEPLLSPAFSGVPLSVYLFLNHGFNLWPFPLFVLFLNRQFPEDVGFRSFIVITVVTLLATIWELVPFVALAAGWGKVYEVVMRSGWSFSLDLYVVLVTLFLFERFYHLYSRHRPLSRSLFFGGIVLGLIILIPIPLSFFMPVKHTYFLGWGLFFYLLIVCFDLIRLQIRITEAEVKRLVHSLDRREILSRFIAPDWASWLGRESLESLKPGDRRLTEAVLVRIRSPEAPDSWLSLVGTAASARHAVLLEWREGTGTWALDAWSETALAFALEVQKKLVTVPISEFKIVLTRSLVEFQLYDMDPQWLPTASGLPEARFTQLLERAQRYGAGLVLDSNLQDGLVIGGWRRHRHLTVDGTEIELYEAEAESMAALKDKTLDAYEEGLVHARSGRLEEALQSLFTVVRQNPFDQAAKVLLTEWGSARLP